jgi:hypothetical protein
VYKRLDSETGSPPTHSLSESGSLTHLLTKIDMTCAAGAITYNMLSALGVCALYEGGDFIIEKSKNVTRGAIAKD